MKLPFAAVAGSAAVLAGIVGCSSQNSDSPEASHAGGGKVTFGSNDAGPVTSVACETKDGFTTINVEGSVHTTVVVTDSESPTVDSVNIGDVGSGNPALAYIEGLSSSPVVASRDAKNYTITGTGMGTDAANPGTPVDMPFDIAVTCP